MMTVAAPLVCGFLPFFFAAAPVQQSAPARVNALALWANSGEDKVTREELRASREPRSVINAMWDGGKVSLFGAKNEVVSFNLVLEAPREKVPGVKVTLEALRGASGRTLTGRKAFGNGVFDWRGRHIELFLVRYLPIRGLSQLAYENYYDERHVPKRMRRPWKGNGKAESGTGWKDRPDADRYYPEIAVPLELVPVFDIEAGQNQSIWVDIYIPRDAPPGTYQGTLLVEPKAGLAQKVAVQLQVHGFALPEAPSAKTMLYIGYGDVNQRYLGNKWPDDGTPQADSSRRIFDRHFQLAHRHKVALIDGNNGPEAWSQDAPRPAWIPRLNGTLFSAARGYDGPGLGVSNGVFCIGAYGEWAWKDKAEKDMHKHADQWVSWFGKNAPGVETFLYLIDEPPREKFLQIEKWSSWLRHNPGVGKSLLSFATVSAPVAAAEMPSLDIPCGCAAVGIARKWDEATARLRAQGKRVWMYGTKRPVTGSFAIEDDGVAMRELAWGQYKKKIDRWFYWESTYYKNFQCATGGETDVFNQAQTFGCNERLDPVNGRTGWNYSNGDGVLFYPGTDTVFPKSSLGVEGPFASLRLKHWRRGIQDVDYLTLAAAKHPKEVQQIVDRLVPRVLWEVGVDDEKDPTYVHADISWSVDPQVWEKARAELALLIERR